MELLKIYRKARELVEKGWHQGQFAADRQGRECSAFDDEAACFCAWGALRRSRANLGIRLPFGPLLEPLQGVIGDVEPTAWNDAPGRTKEEVLEAFDRAISRLEDLELAA